MKANHVITIATFLICSQAQSKQLIWNVDTKFGVSRENAKPGTDLALHAVAEHFKTNPGDQIILKYGIGTYLFLGTDPSIDLPRDLDPGANGRLIIEGEGMRNTTFITSDGSTPDINGQNVHRVTFRGIHFARNYITVTQGTVVSINAEAEEVILEIHKGFPTPEEIWSVPGKPLSQGKYLRKYTDDKSDPKVIMENNRRFPNLQVHYDPKYTYKIDSAKWAFKIDGRWSVARDEYKAGDIIGVKCKHGGNTYQFDGGSDIVFEDCLWTHRSRGVFKNGCTSIRFSRCRIERIPALNGRVPCLATPGGGPQIGQPKDPRISDVVIEDCNFNSCGDDNLALFNVDGAIIRNTYSYNSFAANIKLYRCNDIVIENTEVENGYFIIRKDYDGNEYFLYGLQNTIVNSDFEAPSQPHNLTFKELTHNSVKLLWESSTDNVGVSHYNVYIGANEIGMSVDTTYTVIGLNPSVYYVFRVQAIDSSGNRSAFSKNLGITTLSETDPLFFSETSVHNDGHLSVYPNPFSDQFSVVSQTVVSGGIIRIYDTKGILLLQKFQEGAKTEITASSLSPGIYFLEIESLNSRIYRKIIK
ncbi:MAG: T9SS type A sorting domain-containing protein [Bacteroidales bacterium]